MPAELLDIETEQTRPSARASFVNQICRDNTSQFGHPFAEIPLIDLLIEDSLIQALHLRHREQLGKQPESGRLC